MQQDIDRRLRDIARKAGRKSQNAANVALVAIVAIACTIPTIYVVDTMLFPVVSKATMFNVTESEGGVSFFLRFRKHRNCDILSLIWVHHPSPVYSHPVRVGLPIGDSQPRTLPSGAFVLGPFTAKGLNRDSILLQSTAHTMHRCHPLWKHRRIFYN